MKKTENETPGPYTSYRPRAFRLRSYAFLLSTTRCTGGTVHTARRSLSSARRAYFDSFSRGTNLCFILSSFAVSDPYSFTDGEGRLRVPGNSLPL